jgi:hypothetical protein
MADKRAEAGPSGTPAADGLPDLEIYPVTLDRWQDLRALFSTSPVMSSCWCMSPRLRASEFSRFGSESRRRNEEHMHALVASGTVPGLIAYASSSSRESRPVAWISVGPREEFVRLRRSRPRGAADEYSAEK